MSAYDMARNGFQKIFDIGKERVTIVSITTSRNAQDDLTYVTKKYITEAKLDRGGESMIEGDGGRLGDSDLVMYFPDTVDKRRGLVRGNYILYDDLQYKITKINRYNVAGGLVYTKVYLDESQETLS
jgi:hypothetical protein